METQNIRCVGGGDIITEIKHVIDVNSQKSLLWMSLKVMHRLCFNFFSSLGGGLLMSFHGNSCPFDNFHSVANMRSERSWVRMRECRVRCFFEQLGWFDALRKLCTLHIGSGGTVCMTEVVQISHLIKYVRIVMILGWKVWFMNNDLCEQVKNNHILLTWFYKL